MKNLIKRAIRKAANLVLVKIIGLKNTETLILSLAKLANINLLMLTYNSIGILKYWDSAVSGEDFVINTILSQYFKKDDLIVFDVGANIGDYSQKIRAGFSKSKIYAFEPNPKTFELLTRNLDSLTINCQNLGISSKSSLQKIYTYSDDTSSQHASIYKNVLLDLHKANSIIEMEFKNTTLDDFCKINNINYIDFLKIDTEGHELEVLKGGMKMIHENKIGIIQFEFNEMNIVSRVFLKDFYEILKGYDIYRLDSNKLIPLFEYNSINEIFKFQNLLAINKKLVELI